MNSIIRLAAVVAGLILLMHVTPSWGQPTCACPGCNPTFSDSGGNTAGGTNALIAITSGADNTAFGDRALWSNTEGIRNTASGAFALGSNSTGSANTASGNAALGLNTTGGFNTASGSNALAFNTTGNYNSALGFQALHDNTSGLDSTATGAQALYSNTTGYNNAASGVNALFSNTTGSGNTANGVLALEQNTAGGNNTAIGFKALKKSQGTKNIGIGYQAGVTLTTGSNNILIGNSGAGDESQTIRVGTAQTRTFVAGINTASVSGAQVMVDTITGQLGIVTSSARYKRDIEAIASRSQGLLKLRPVTFVYKDDASAASSYRLIAEEVAAVYPELVTRTATGEIQTVKYHELIPMLPNELQKQRQEFQQALQSQQQELAELRALVSQGRGKVVLGSTGE